MDSMPALVQNQPVDQSAARDTPLFASLLGPAFAQLPEPTQRVHDARQLKELAGRCEVQRGRGPLAWLLGVATGLPRASGDVDVRVQIRRTDRGEVWTRHFGGQRMQSRLWSEHGLLCERLGMATFRFQLDMVDQRLVWRLRSVRALGVPLPLAWFRGVAAEEGVEGGCYVFRVSASLPGVPLLVAYSGWLE